MRARLWPAVAVSFGALLLLLTLFAWIVSREAAQIHERTKTAHQVYKRADDAISDIQANINKGALIEQNGLRTPDAVETQRRIADLQRSTANDCTTLEDLVASSQKTQLLALRQGLNEYWSSIQQSLGRPRTQRGEQRLFSELESQPEKVLDLAGRIDSLNQASLAHEEEEIEGQQAKLREFAIAATLSCCCWSVPSPSSAQPTWLGSTTYHKQRDSAPRMRSKSFDGYRTSSCESRRKREKRSRESSTTR